MKTRVIQKLASLAQGKDSELEKDLIKEGIKSNIPERASEVLSNILHKYSWFSVSTIDSFFHRVIRSFARELKLQLGYDVEMDQETVLTKITDEMFDQIGEDEKLRGYLEDFVFYNIDEDGDWKIEHKLKDLAREIFKERYWEKKESGNADLADSREKMPEFISVMFAIVNSFEGTMNSVCADANKIMDEYSLTMDDFPHKKSGFMNYLLNKIGKKDYEPTTRVLEAYSDINKWFSKKPPPAVQPAINAGLHELLINAVDNYNTNHRKYYSAKELTKTVYILGIFKDLLDKLKIYRDENKLLLISDTNNILKKVISNEASPFIYEKIGNVYKNYLIDEFQDTSNYQWNNLLPLLVNSISEGNFSMIVGDVKQSVYRWRSGNMKLLLEKVEEDLVAFKDLIDERYLTDNWRSLKKIINFNNRFFESASKKIAERNEEYSKLIEDSYKEVTQNNTKGADGGYVNVTFIPREKGSELSTADKSDTLTLNYIKQLITDGFELRDIMVLVRKNEEGSRIASLLMESGYKVISNDSLLITNSPKVKLLINLLKYISDSANLLAKTEVLFNYLTYIKASSGNNKNIFEDHKKSRDSLFSSSLPKEFFDKDGNRINPKLTGFTLYELIENLIRIFDLNDKADAYLLRFLDTALEYVKKNNSDISGFILWWEENKQKISIIVPQQDSAIRVLTIHKAKGLQSPAVIIPYANWEFDISGSRDFIWASSEIDPFNRSSAFLVKAVGNLKNSYFEKDYEDEFVLTNIDNLNLLYVAFTRAIEQLYIICPEKGNNSYNAAKLIRSVVLPDVDKNAAAEQNIEYGKREKKKTKPRVSSAKSYTTDSFISSNYFNKTVIQKKNRNLKFSNNIKLIQKINKGILLHEALSHITTTDDVEISVNKLLTDGLINESEKAFYQKELNDIVNLPEAKDWFSGNWEVKAERDMLIPNANAIRPDRVLINRDNAIIIDYKTGIESSLHENQINEYADALNEAGYKIAGKYLYYIIGKKIKKL